MNLSDFERMMRRNYIFKNNMNLSEHWEEKRKSKLGI